MALMAYDKEGNLKQVARYDTRLMLTLVDIFPSDFKSCKLYLKKKKIAPKGRIRDYYNCYDNPAVLRKIFTTLFKAILGEITCGRCKFIVPITRARSKPEIFVGNSPLKVTNSNYFYRGNKKPYIKYKFSSFSSRAMLDIYVNKKLYSNILKVVKDEGHFSKMPRDIEYFLPYVYNEFYYLEESGIKAWVLEAFNIINYHLRRGEEIRIFDRDGEIRIFRNLGKDHDRIMKTVNKRRITRNLNKSLNGTVS
jgi:hypothetical protein